LASGKPRPDQWFVAVDRLSQALADYQKSQKEDWNDIANGRDDDVPSDINSDVKSLASHSCTSNNSIQQIQSIAESIQKECHQIVEYIMKSTDNKEVNVQDATNVFIFRKLAELFVAGSQTNSIE